MKYQLPLFLMELTPPHCTSVVISPSNKLVNKYLSCHLDFLNNRLIMVVEVKWFNIVCQPT